MRKMLIPILLFTASLFAADYGTVTTEKVVETVYLFRTSPYGVGLSGNSVAVLSEQGTLIFDSNGLPETAEIILKEIQKLTKGPVHYLINSHWHWDHWAGNQVYLAAFPSLRIIAHEKTRRQMMEVEPRWNDRGLKQDLPAYIDQIEEGLEKAKNDGKPAEEIAERQKLLEAARRFLQQKLLLKKTFPNVTYERALTLHVGGRPIEIRHARAITVGDSYAYLPNEKILITGDVLLSPYPYAIGGAYPADWVKTLEEFVALKPSIIIPGHGAPQQPEFLTKNLQLFRLVLQQVKDAKNSGSTLEDTKKVVAARAKDFAQILGISDPQITEEFKLYFLDVFVARAYRELDAPLNDLPDGLE